MLKVIKDNKGKILGGIIGFFIALLIIVAWPVLLVIFLVFLGILLGKIFDTVSKAHRWLQENFSSSTKEKRKNESG